MAQKPPAAVLRGQALVNERTQKHLRWRKTHPGEYRAIAPDCASVRAILDGIHDAQKSAYGAFVTPRDMAVALNVKACLGRRVRAATTDPIDAHIENTRLLADDAAFHEKKYGTRVLTREIHAIGDGQIGEALCYTPYVKFHDAEHSADVFGKGARVVTAGAFAYIGYARYIVSVEITATVRAQHELWLAELAERATRIDPARTAPFTYLIAVFCVIASVTRSGAPPLPTFSLSCLPLSSTHQIAPARIRTLFEHMASAARAATRACDATAFARDIEPDVFMHVTAHAALTFPVMALVRAVCAPIVALEDFRRAACDFGAGMSMSVHDPAGQFLREILWVIDSVYEEIAPPPPPPPPPLPPKTTTKNAKKAKKRKPARPPPRVDNAPQENVSHRVVIAPTALHQAPTPVPRAREYEMRRLAEITATASLDRA